MASTVSCLILVALGVHRARSLTVEHYRGIDSIILPRAVVRAGENEGCGKELSGYLKTGAGLMWSDREPGYAKDHSACKKRCDSSKGCVAFTARQPKKGKLQCDLYRGLVPHPDHRALSYAKCAKGVGCPNNDGVHGFEFTHAGAWAHGVKVELHSKGSCAKTCAQDKACVGFTHRLPQHGMHECYHYNFTANGEGPKVDMRAQTYSKCAIPQQQAAEAVATPNAPEAPEAPSLPLSTVVVHKDDTDKCSASGFLMTSTGWWWSEYDKMANVGNTSQCEQECNSLEDCTFFVYSSTDIQSDKAECYLHKGLVASYSKSAVAYRKCQLSDKHCDSGKASSAISTGYPFSHHGTWRGGRQITDVAFQSCQLVCNSQPTCVAMSWDKDQTCTLFQPVQQKSGARAKPTDGAIGFSKCISVDEAREETRVD